MLSVDRKKIEDDAIIDRNPLTDVSAIDDAAERIIGDIERARDMPVQALANSEHVMVLDYPMNGYRSAGFETRTFRVNGLLVMHFREVRDVNTILRQFLHVGPDDPILS